VNTSMNPSGLLRQEISLLADEYQLLTENPLKRWFPDTI